MVNTERNSLKRDFIDDIDSITKCWIGGQHVPLTVGKVPNGKPTWFDEEKFKAGMEFVRKYYGSIFFAHLISLTMLLYSPQVLKPMIFTGKSETPEKSYKRYVSTAIHVLSWYHGDIWDPQDKARRSLERVKKIHENVARVVNSPEMKGLVDNLDIAACGSPLHRGCPLHLSIQQDLDDVIPDSAYGLLFHPSYHSFRDVSHENRVPYFNQLDMSGTQFAFMGLIVLYPEKFGMLRATQNEMEGFIHMWRCIGWILGIEDNYNFCRFDNLPDAVSWTKHIMKHIIKPSLKVSVAAEYEQMGRAVALGAKNYLSASYETLILFIGWVLDVPMHRVSKKVTKADRRGFEFLTFAFGLLGNFPLVNYLFNAVTYWTLKLIVDPPFLWPRSLRPPKIDGLKCSFIS